MWVQKFDIFIPKCMHFFNLSYSLSGGRGLKNRNHKSKRPTFLLFSLSFSRNTRIFVVVARVRIPRDFVATRKLLSTSPGFQEFEMWALDILRNSSRDLREQETQVYKNLSKIQMKEKREVQETRTWLEPLVIGFAMLSSFLSGSTRSKKQLL